MISLKNVQLLKQKPKKTLNQPPKKSLRLPLKPRQPHHFIWVSKIYFSDQLCILNAIKRYLPWYNWLSGHLGHLLNELKKMKSPGI